MRRSATSPILPGFRRALLSIAILLAASPAAAQRRADFEAAVLSEAATETAANACHGAGAAGARPIPRELRARMLGRAITVPAGPGDARPRRVALVRVATDQADANGAIAFRLMVVLLAGSGRAWTSLGHAEIPLENAPFDYEETLLRIARLEDVDDDGEQELLVVIESQTEVQCGTGYCSVRATAVLDVAEPGLPVLVVIPSQITCQAAIEETRRGTVFFRDTDGDGHRDLVARTQSCVTEFDAAAGAYGDPVCAPAVSVVHRWDPATDRYRPPVPLRP